jgi:hypothetical protein
MTFRFSSFVFSTCTVLLLNSCAVTSLPDFKKVKVTTTQPAKIIYQSIDSSIDTIPLTSDNKAILFFARGNKPAIFTVKTDSTEQLVTIAPINSFGYNLYAATTLGISTIFLRSNPKSYSYPSKIFLTSTTQSGTYSRTPEKNQGALYAHISMPLFNFFYSSPVVYSPHNSFGMMGFSGGLDYYYHDNRFISATGLIAFNTFLYAVHDPQAYKITNVVFAELSHNHDMGNYYFGYGITVGRNEWEILESSLYDKPFRQAFNTFGAIGKIYLRMGTNWSAGLIYRPSFYRFSAANHFTYEHLMSLDLNYRFRLK